MNTKPRRRSQPHIAAIDFARFYSSACRDPAAGRFVRKVDSLPAKYADAKMILHQAARMVWLADRIDKVARGRPALQVLFYLIAAEAVAKIAFQFKKVGQSKRYVKRFFGEICSKVHRTRLARAFSYSGIRFLSPESAVDLLYGVRCNVAHEGMYYNFNLMDDDNILTTTHVQGQENLVSHITLEEIRRVVLEGALLGAKKRLAAEE